MDNKNWIRVLDNYLKTAKMLSEDYENLDDFQRAIIQELKKAFKRIQYERSTNNN